MDKIITKSLALSLSTMPAFILTTPHGASISSICIFLLSLIVLIAHYPIDMALSKKEKILICSLLLLPIVIIFDVILRDLRFHYLDYYTRFILVILVFFTLRTIKVSLAPLMIGILVGAIGAGMLALYQKYHLNLHDIQGYVMQINFGNISILLGVMSLAGLFMVNSVGYKKSFYIITLLAFIMGITGSLLSGTRGGWIAIPFFIGLFIMFSPLSKAYKIIGSIILILALILVYYSNDYIQSRVDSVYKNTQAYYNSNSDESVTSTGRRLVEWKAGWLMFIEHPIFGIGSGEYKQALKEKIDAGEVRKIDLVGHAHNEALQIMVITGIIGLFAYLSLYAGAAYFFYTSLVKSHNTRVKYLSFLGVMIVGDFFIFGLTNYSFGHNMMVLFFAVMVAVLAGMVSRIENQSVEA
ncbi:O-antigen ligase family protein [Bathymodiolus heckerae thiotrophic gill symbiont]|uniref:O-antigen ligase family protein n=1 Tax=Bathymodiolus heckerae thiotrophic gill symbiont TaxID=1052212 RepID=UPI0010FD788C|nr:O-antigen ligase [Bathymodiolus heckerae thiotrophic gill symbiont]